MSPAAWFAENFPDSIAADQLERPLARKLVALLRGGGYGGATLTGCRRKPETRDELLLANVDVGLGQRKLIHDVHSWEPVALVFGSDEKLPAAYAVRQDFPGDVPHLNVTKAGHPRSLCLYDASPDEVRITYTALRFIERVRWWLRETAYGRLHGDEQPLDPLFHQAGISFILPSDFLAQPQSAYIAGMASSRPGHPFILEPVSADRVKSLEGQARGFAGVSLLTDPIPHGRMQIL